MEKYNLQFKDEQKWASSDNFGLQSEFFTEFQTHAQDVLNKSGHYPHLINEFRLLAQDIQKSKDLQNEISIQLRNVLSAPAYEEYKKTQQTVFSYPSVRAATRLVNAYSSEIPLDDTNAFNEILTFLNLAEQQRQLYTKHKPLFLNFMSEKDWRKSGYDAYSGKYHHSLSTWEEHSFDKAIKAIQAVQKKMKNGDFVSAERNTENSLMNKTAWAIFCKYGHDNSTGYKAKNGELGDISTARLFDSDKGAQRTAKSMGLGDSNYDIVELQVTYKKRMHMTNGFNSTELDAAEAILEKQKIEAFFKEISFDKIEEHVEEVKAKKKNKI